MEMVDNYIPFSMVLCEELLYSSKVKFKKIHKLYAMQEDFITNLHELDTNMEWTLRNWS